MAEDTTPEGSASTGVLDIHQATEVLTQIMDRENDTPEQEVSEETSSEEIQEDAELEDEGEIEDAETDDLSDDNPEELELAEDDDDEELEEEPLQPQKWKVKAAGQELEVTEEELVKGYQRHSDYTRGKQQLAETRKQLASEMQQARAERQRMAQALDAVSANIAEVPPPDEDLRDIDPTEYLLQKDLYDKNQQKIRNIQAERKRLADTQQHEHQQALLEMRDRENNSLLEKLPEWKDPEKRDTEQKKMMAFAQDALGFSEAELMQIYDSRLVLALQKLWKYEAAAAPNSKARKKVQNAPKKVVSSKARRPRKAPAKRVQQARRRLKTNGKVNDLASYLLTQATEE